MPASHNKPLKLVDYAERLEDPRERTTVLRALDDAANVPPDAVLLDDIEARFTDEAGLIDLQAYLSAEFAAAPARNEFEALMHAARQVQILVAFQKIETPSGARFVRIDAIH